MGCVEQHTQTEPCSGQGRGAGATAAATPFIDLRPMTRSLFEPATANASINERMDMVFADSDLVPLLIQENYVNHKPIIAGVGAWNVGPFGWALGCRSACVWVIRRCLCVL